MPEMHLKQPKFTYSASGIQKFKETGDTNHIYKNELDRACFQHDMAFGDFEDLARRTASDKVLRDKASNIAKILSMMDIQEDWFLRFTNFLIQSQKEVVLIMRSSLANN